MSNMRMLGKTGCRIPPMVFGTTSLGNLFKAPPASEKAAIVHAWIETDFSPVVIDSAGKYGAGLALEVIGKELDRLAVPADRVLISNKLGWRRVPLTTPEPTFEPGAWVDIQHDAVQDISRDGILRCWEEGNRLLGDYRAQLLSVHDPDEYLAAAFDPDDRHRRLQQIVDGYGALCELRDQGEAVGIGVGAKDWRVIHELDKHCDFDWVMLANSFTIMQHPPELLEFMDSLSQRGIGIINSALFHGGFLLGGAFFDYRPLDPQDAEDRARLDYRQRFQQVCRDVGVTPFEAGVAFGKCHPAIAAIALSSSRADRVASHVAASQVALSADAWRAFSQAGLISPRLESLLIPAAP